MTKQTGKKDKHGHNFIIFSQATGQTWYHTSAYHLSALGFYDSSCSSFTDMLKHLKFTEEKRTFMFKRKAEICTVYVFAPLIIFSAGQTNHNGLLLSFLASRGGGGGKGALEKISTGMLELLFWV